MASVDEIQRKIFTHIERTPQKVDEINRWFSNLQEFEIIDFYISLNPDEEKLPESECVLTIITRYGLHGIDFQHNSEDIYNFVHLKNIHWIREHHLENTTSYGLVFFMGMYSLLISDNVEKKEDLQTFAHNVRKAIEGA